ncbi:uncharacterized protein LOC127806478 [Diospyros lotus]|uniref:uncharacterized protein LOC127806478 n=1 Tax=Diospyros lotus TaxID=55363 RepID=UPI00225727EF|nr:uncharacterized protein LOC127806478 [Diospyros lotus]
MEDEQRNSQSQSLKHKLKQTLCLSCCFRHHRHHDDRDSDERPVLLRAPSIWLKSRAQDLPEIRDKCRHLINRIGGQHHRRSSSSADFRYDPLSYSLNFDRGFDDSLLDEAPLRNFSSRVPASAPVAVVPEADGAAKMAVPRVVACV